ncbi:MAG: hypothetical protein Q4G13_06890 [Moraxella sp.]|nr:hypothetical protein [Moraxella sp.]
MIKKILFSLLTLILIGVQVVFILVIQIKGDIFTKLWHDWGVTPAAYSTFVFENIAFFWALPILCLVVAAAAWTTKASIKQILLLLLSLLLSTAVAVAMVVAIYHPSHLIQG